MNIRASELRCPLCLKFKVSCICGIAGTLTDLTKIISFVPTCNICKKEDVVKYGVCASCMEDYGLNEEPADPVPAAEPESEVSEEEIDRITQLFATDVDNDFSFEGQEA